MNDEARKAGEENFAASAGDFPEPAGAAAPESTEPQAQPRTEESPRGPGAKRIAMGVAAAVAAWAVPGLGHLLLGRWRRALIFFAAVGGLAITGYVMRGDLFGSHPSDGFNALGFLADVGSGIFYFLAHRLEAAGPDVSLAAGDYGTRFLAAAGVVNLLCVLDAYEIATGARE